MGESITSTLAGTDPDGDRLTFAIADAPSKGQISNFDPNSGGYTYTSTTLTPETDSFTFQVNDGKTNAATTGTVNVTIDAVLFTGHWQTKNALVNGATSCSNPSFRIGHARPVGATSGTSPSRSEFSRAGIDEAHV
jgi:hypothetical protein